MSRGTSVVAIAATLLAASGAGAEELYGFVEVVADSSDNEREDEAGILREQENESLTYRLNFTWDRLFFPSLRLLLGGFFETQELDQSLSVNRMAPVESEFTSDRARPYADLILTTDPYRAELTYNLDEERVESSTGASLTLVQERWGSTLGWRPDGYPSAELRLFRTEDFDRAREREDRVTETAQLNSEYRPIESLYLRYGSTLENERNRLEDTEFRLITHGGRVSWDDTLWDGRLALSGDYSITYTEQKTIRPGFGDVDLPLLPLAGLSSIDDTPGTDPLLPNAGLVDQNRVVGTGVDLGLPAPGADDRARNIGLDFGNVAAFNVLLVWVDRELPVEISQSFSWRIYTSDDNFSWNLEQVVAPALFGPFVDRFELVLDDLASRYVKVVVDPLDPAVPFAQNFRTIQVTEFEAVQRTAAAELEASRDTTRQLLSVASRARLLDKPKLYYEGTYFLNKADPNPSTSTLSNGLSLFHRFNPVFNSITRLAREDGQEIGRDRWAHVYSTALVATPIDTLRYNLVFGGRDEDVEGEVRRDRSIFLSGVAELYDGVDVNLGAGRSYRKNPTGEEIVSRDLNLVLTLVPHRTVTVNLLLQDRTDERGLFERFEQATHVEEASVSWRPVRTIYVFGSYRVEEQPQVDRRTINNYNVNWAPFPDGTLHFTFGYNERYRSDLESTERIVAPAVRWDITRRTYLDVGYQRITRDSIRERFENEVFRGTLRVGF